MYETWNHEYGYTYKSWHRDNIRADATRAFNDKNARHTYWQWQLAYREEETNLYTAHYPGLLPPQMPSLFQLAGDVLRRAELIHLFVKHRPKVQNEWRSDKAKCKQKFEQVLKENEDQFRDRIFEQLRKRPLSKVLLWKRKNVCFEIIFVYFNWSFSLFLLLL